MEVSPSLRLLVLGGDHMLGRAIQLTLPHRTRLEESLMDSMPAWYYLQLGLRDALPSLPSIREANRTGGYLYRHLMPLCTALEPDVTLFNVETSITTCLDHEDAPPKAIHYHTQPDNLFGLVDNLTPSPLVVESVRAVHPADDGQVFRRHVAHELIDAGLVDCIYGHWSHHLRGVEIYKGKCILYDAGDLVNDYESFTNPGEDCYLKIGAVFAVDVATDSRRVVQITVIPMYMEQLQLVRLGSGSQQWQPRSKCIESAPSLEQVREFLTEMSLLDCQESLPWRRVWAVEGPALLYP
ncbi:unnamed protein product [Aphanomyces euteiches]